MTSQFSGYFLIGDFLPTIPHLNLTQSPIKSLSQFEVIQQATSSFVLEN